MLNSFDSNLNMLVSESISDAHVRLSSHNTEYQEATNRISNILDMLDDTPKEELKNKASNMLEYIHLSEKFRDIEDLATYFKGVSDCMRLLSTLGCLK